MTDKTVELIPVPAQPGAPFYWKVKHGWKTGKPGDYPKVDLKKDSGPNVIAFTIKGQNDYKFSADPIWIQKGLTKPNGTGVDPEIILAPQLYNNGKTLVIVDWNIWKGDLTYLLNIDGAPKGVDPVITNGGGGYVEPPAPPGFAPGGYSQSQYITAAGIALIVGIVIGYFAHKLLFARKPI